MGWALQLRVGPGGHCSKTASCRCLGRKHMEDTAAAVVEVEDAKGRCAALKDRLHRLSLLPSAKSSLFRLINAELAFLHRLSSPSPPLSLNIGHLEAVAHVLLHPSVTAVSRVCKSIHLSASHTIYVDVVCSLNGNPAWFIVSDRKPRSISWDGKNTALKTKIHKLVDAARLSPLALRPLSIVLFFSHGLVDSVYEKLEREFGGIKLEMEPFFYEELDFENKWTNLVFGRSFPHACVVEIEVDQERRGMKKFCPAPARIGDASFSCKKRDEYTDVYLLASLRSLVSGIKCWCCAFDDNVELESGLLKQSLRDVETKLVNFDTTAMVAIVSGISNGKISKLLATSESELRARFKGNFDFVITQVQSENQNPIHKELFGVMLGKQGIICKSVCSEFQGLVSMCGGPNEKLRAEYFMKFLKVVPDCPSPRLLSLPTTRKLALKNKVVFGTGDHWCAPTVTANMAFVRAVSQTGLSLSVIEHRPRALIGD